MTYPMSTIIAKRELTRTTQNGVSSPVEVTIGTPTLIPAQDDLAECWYCPVQVLGIEHDEVRPAFGVDSMQALSLALYMAGMLIATSSVALEVEGHEENYGFPATPV